MEIIDFVGNNPPIRLFQIKLIPAISPDLTMTLERRNMAKLRFLNNSLRISKGYLRICHPKARTEPPNTDRSHHEHP
ncbi:hypothetical protein RKLH11_2426 [Rhodobacteraceae bacterium KLH11]|nr:hypothetical protein RKLH11_2426 [Rhodobacteraceae bacterium KLH11]